VSRMQNGPLAIGSPAARFAFGSHSKTTGRGLADKLFSRFSPGNGRRRRQLSSSGPICDTKYSTYNRYYVNYSRWRNVENCSPCGLWIVGRHCPASAYRRHFEQFRPCSADVGSGRSGRSSGKYDCRVRCRVRGRSSPLRRGFWLSRASALAETTLENDPRFSGKRRLPTTVTPAEPDGQRPARPGLEPHRTLRFASRHEQNC